MEQYLHDAWHLDGKNLRVLVEVIVVTYVWSFLTVIEHMYVHMYLCTILWHKTLVVESIGEFGDCSLICLNFPSKHNQSIKTYVRT